MAIIENINPPIVPTAKANQNTSFCPSQMNGINPNTVEMMVRSTPDFVAFWLRMLEYSELRHVFWEFKV